MTDTYDPNQPSELYGGMRKDLSDLIDIDFPDFPGVSKEEVWNMKKDYENKWNKFLNTEIP